MAGEPALPVTDIAEEIGKPITVPTKPGPIL